MSCWPNLEIQWEHIELGLEQYLFLTLKGSLNRCRIILIIEITKKLCSSIFSVLIVTSDSPFQFSKIKNSCWTWWLWTIASNISSMTDCLTFLKINIYNPCLRELRRSNKSYNRSRKRPNNSWPKSSRKRKCNNLKIIYKLVKRTRLSSFWIRNWILMQINRINLKKVKAYNSRIFILPNSPFNASENHLGIYLSLHNSMLLLKRANVQSIVVS